MKIKRKLKDLKFKIKMWYQKKRHGVSDIEVWNVGSSIAEYGYPLIKEWLKRGICGHPMGMTEEEWLIILQKIEYAFKCTYEEEHGPFPDWDKRIDIDKEKEKSQRVSEGFELFGRYILAMWD